jgi:hypothetical protein
VAEPGISGEKAAIFAAVIEAAELAGHLPAGGIWGPAEMPDAGEGMCCDGSAVMGPQYCTCWEPAFDLGQEEIRPGEAGCRDAMCGDCAYRPGSPERCDDPDYRGDQEFLDRIVVTGERFFCHQGMRRALRLVHPSGAVMELPPGAYDPPVTGGVPYKADGSPGDLCAGWAARRLHYMTREAPGPSASAELPAGECHPFFPAGAALPAPFPSPGGAGTGSAAPTPPVGAADSGGTVEPAPVRRAPGEVPNPRRPGHPLSPPLAGGGEPGPSPATPPGDGPAASPAGAERDRPAPAARPGGQDARDAWKREIAKQNADKRRGRAGKRQDPGYRPGMGRRRPG